MPRSLWPAQISVAEGVRVRVTAGITDDVVIYARADNGNFVDWGSVIVTGGPFPLPWKGQRFGVALTQEFETRSSPPGDTAAIITTLQARAQFDDYIATVPMAVISYVEVQSVTCEADAKGFWVLTPLSSALIHVRPTVNIALGGTSSPATEFMDCAFFADLRCKASWEGAEDDAGGGSEGGGGSGGGSSSKAKSKFARVGALLASEGASARAAESADAADADFF